MAPDLNDPREMAVALGRRPRPLPQVQYDPTIRVPTRPMLPGPRRGPPRPPSPPSPPSPPTPMSDDDDESVILRRRRTKKKTNKPSLTRFVRQLKKMTPQTTYKELRQNTGNARIGLLQWFKLAAHHLLEGNIQPLHKQHEKWVERNRDMLKVLIAKAPMAQKMEVLMRPGGRGFLGGILIRILLTWKKRLEKERSSKKFSKKSISKKNLALLKTHRRTLKTLEKADGPTRQKILNQKGGFIGALLASLAGPLLKNIL